MIDITNMSLLDFVNSMPGMAAIKDKQSKIVACSPALLSMLGVDDLEKIIGMDDSQLPCDASVGIKDFQRQDMCAMEHGEHQSIDIYRYASDELKFLYTEKKRLFYNNQLVGVSCTSIDLIDASKILQKFNNMLAYDMRFLQLDKQHTSYEFQSSYPDFNLTPGESFCLFYLLRGKSNHEISQILHRSIRTIEGRIATIRHKMGCQTRQQLIELSIARGYHNIILKQLFNSQNISIDLF